MILDTEEKATLKLRLAVLTLVALGAALPSAATAAVPQGVVSALVEKASRAGTVERVEAVETNPVSAKLATGTVETSEQAAPQDLTVARNEKVDFVVMRGQFLESDVPIPRGAKVPSGTVMAYTVNAGTTDVDALYVGNRVPQLSGLGEVRSEVPNVTRLSSTATATRVRHQHAQAHTAIWSGGCSPSNEHHCYAISYWNMSGGEEVAGTQAEIETSNMNVPTPATQFVSNEIWSLFPQLGGQYWIESGQIAGRGEGNCCTLFFFMADDSPSGGFEYRKGWQVTGGTLNNYGQK